MNIIVVDDEERIRLGLCKLIEQAGENYVIIGSYGSGQELLDEIEHLEPDLIITDIKMPQMTGIQLISKVTGMRKKAKFAVLSGFNDFEYVREALRYEVKDYLLKPVNLDELNRMLAKVEAEVRQENNRRRLESEDLVSLLLFADDRQLPALLKEEVSGELDRSRLFAEHYAVLLIGGDPAITDEHLEKWTGDWQRERKIVRNESLRQAVIIAIGQNDHANTVRDLAVTLLQRLPGFTKAKIGYSSVFSGSSRLGQAYREASAAFQQAWYNNELRGCSGVSNQTAHKEERYRLLRIIDKEVLPALQVCDVALASRAFENWLTECAQYRFHWDELREVCSDMHVLISEEIKQRLDRQLSVGGEPGKNIAPESFEDWRAFAAQLRSDMSDRFHTLEQGRSENKAVETIKAYLQKHYTEEIELQRLADLVYLTPSYLSKLFKTETGETITDYLTSERIEQAKRLLRDEYGLKTYMIGEMVGYADPAYFTKVFKKMTGKTPKEYRDIVR
ncbi:response regulator transcription factor [Paenibacillus glycanilyticus]|uniref:response regulator transcription factor n=1 Tax=Paenibacillus glycanilyticus TaxID=126569 RepID=UPI000FD89AD1|nr:response regulator [Paenibacillus glycanilyticus]